MTKQAINTRTQEEYDALMEYYESKGEVWIGYQKPHDVNVWDARKEQMCIVLTDMGLEWESIDFYKDQGYEIIPYTEFAKANITESPNYEERYREAVKLLEWSKQICSNIQRTKTYGTKFPETASLGNAIDDFFENTGEEEIELTKQLLETLGFTRLPLEKDRGSYMGRGDLNFGYPVLFLNEHTYLSINASEPTGYVFLKGLRIKCKTVGDLKKLYFVLTGNVLKAKAFLTKHNDLTPNN